MVSVINKIAEESAGYSTGISSGGVTGRRDNGKDQPPIPESVLAKLWQKRAARQEWFRTSKGRRVRVLYPGRPGITAGPDFRNALLEFEDVGLVQGDVEIHRRQQDWYSHGHGNDPNYNGVVLHAALDLDPSPTNLRSGGEAPVVSLRPLLANEDVPDRGVSESISPSIWNVLEPLGYPCPQSAAEMTTLLERAGDARFAAKSQRFRKFVGEQDPEQTLYEGLLESLGYRQNQQPFLQLAGCAPYFALCRAAREVAQERRAEAVESWLLKLSGLLPADEAARIALPRAGFGKPMSGREWHCFRVRPANHPRRRIGGAARMIVKFLEVGLLPGLGQCSNADSAKKLTDALTISDAGTTYIGTSRAKEMAVNVVLPFLHGLSAASNGAGHAERYLELYHKFGKLPENEITRELAEQLIDPTWGRLVSTARRQQGLIHLQRLLSGAAS